MNSESRGGRARLDIYLPSGTDGVQLKNKIRITAEGQGKTVSGWVNDAIQEQLQNTDSSTVGMKMAAGLLIALGPELATPIIREFSDGEIDSVSSQIAQMQRIDPDMQDFVFQEAEIAGEVRSWIKERRDFVFQEAMKGRDIQNLSSSLDEPVFDMAIHNPGKIAGKIRSWIKERQESSEGFSFKIQP